MGTEAPSSAAGPLRALEDCPTLASHTDTTHSTVPVFLVANACPATHIDRNFKARANNSVSALSCRETGFAIGA